MARSGDPVPVAPAALIDDVVLPGRLDRLVAELVDEGVPALDGAPDMVAAVAELAYAMRPAVHERRVPTYGAIVPDEEPDAESWSEAGDVPVDLIPLGDLDARSARRFADGLSSFAVRSEDGITHLACFRRDVSDEYELVELRRRIGGLLVQRHSSGEVRVFGPAGVVRWDGIAWRHDPPAARWLRRLEEIDDTLPHEPIGRLLRFAVHGLCSRRIGATLVWRPADAPPAPRVEELVRHVPRLRLDEPGQVEAIGHALSQTDGAAVFDDDHLLAIGVWLTWGEPAERIPTSGGMRHISALRYSHDDPHAVVIVVSEAGRVTLVHRGAVVDAWTPDGERIG